MNSNLKKIFDIMVQPEKVWEDLSEFSQLYRLRILAYIVACHLSERETSVREMSEFFKDCSSCVLLTCVSLSMMGILEVTPEEMIKIP